MQVIKITDETFIEIIGKYVDRVEKSAHNTGNVKYFFAKVLHLDVTVKVAYNTLDSQIEIWVREEDNLEELCGTVLILCEDTKYYQNRSSLKEPFVRIGDKIAFEIIRRTDQGRHIRSTKI